MFVLHLLNDLDVSLLRVIQFDRLFFNFLRFHLLFLMVLNHRLQKTGKLALLLKCCVKIGLVRSLSMLNIADVTLDSGHLIAHILHLAHDICQVQALRLRHKLDVLGETCHLEGYKSYRGDS